MIDPNFRNQQPVNAPDNMQLLGEHVQTPTIPATEVVAESPANVPVQIDRSVFLAARLRETIAELANLRSGNANLLVEVGTLRQENARYKADIAQNEINVLEADYGVGKGAIFQQRPDGSFWRLPSRAPQD